MELPRSELSMKAALPIKLLLLLESLLKLALSSPLRSAYAVLLTLWRET